MTAGMSTPVNKYTRKLVILVDASVIGAIKEFKPNPANLYDVEKLNRIVAIGADTIAATIGGIARRGLTSKLGN